MGWCGHWGSWRLVGVDVSRMVLRRQSASMQVLGCKHASTEQLLQQASAINGAHTVHTHIRTDTNI
eukprot:1207858-Pleurochrysis_carterae.AAC.2